MIIGLAGKARVGKSAAAEHLVKNYEFKEKFFAQALKGFASKYFNVPEEELYGEKSETSRRIMQGIGEMVREEMGNDYWIKRTLNGLYAGRQRGYLGC